MSEGTSPYDPLYLKGIEYFNECDFFESHEVWEELWSDHHGPSRKFYQGLIQSAVALHHFCNDNTRGARKLYHSSRAYLQPYCPLHEGIDLDSFLLDMEKCFAEVIHSEKEYPDTQIDPDLLPEIHLVDSALQ